MSWVGGAEAFGALVGPIAHHSHRDEIATDCRMDPMSDHWPLLVADPLDGERPISSQLRPRAGAIAIGRHDYSAARQAVVELCGGLTPAAESRRHAKRGCDSASAGLRAGL